MRIVNMHEAKSSLSRLVEAARAGEQITIAEAGRLMARLVPVEAEDDASRFGFLKERFAVPDDFDTMHSDEIAESFEVDE